MSDDPRTPVTILTGFLGAGKTTLLNQIIREHPNTRFAIIENEFGATNIDSELVVGVEEGIFELSNGCICCSLSSELAETLQQLVQRQDQYDHLLIETTGIANPQAVAAPFLTDPQVQRYFRLDATLCMIDTPLLSEALKLQQEASWQVAAGDYLIFNKMDLASPEALAEAQQLCKELNPYARQLRSQAANIETAPLLSAHAFTPAIIEQQTKNISSKHDHQHHQISSQTYYLAPAFDLIKFRHFIQVLLLFQSSRIYRMKGILHLSGLSHRMIFQSVQQQTVFSKGSEWLPEETKASKLVVIGKALDRAQFEKRLRSCLA